MRNSKRDLKGVLGGFIPLCFVIIAGVVYFLVAWRLDLWRAWIYFGTAFTCALLGGILMLVFAPTLSHERGKPKEDAKIWDKVLLRVYFVLGLVVMPLVAAFDARFGWSLMPGYFIIPGAAIQLLMLVITQWAMLANPFFEGLVRIQKDRGHKVISSGPYRIVRHPGYLGMFFGTLPLPFITGSVYALIPCSIMMILIVIRTALEDKTLQAELAGYKEYAARVRFRLFPGIW